MSEFKMHPKYLHLFTTFNFSPLKYNLIFLDRAGDFLLKTITTVLFTLIVNKWSLKSSEICQLKIAKI